MLRRETWIAGIKPGPSLIAFVVDTKGDDEMGWAARLNQTVRDGQRPARLGNTGSTIPQALAVFTPTAAPLVDKNGDTKVGPNGKPLMIYGFRPNAKAGTELSGAHYFDGSAIRRKWKANGKEAKRARVAARKRAGRAVQA